MLHIEDLRPVCWRDNCRLSLATNREQGSFLFPYVAAVLENGTLRPTFPRQSLETLRKVMNVPLPGEGKIL